MQQLEVSILTNSYSDVSVSSETTYYYQITALDLTGNESVSAAEVSTTTPDITPPAVPSGLSGISTAYNSISLDWDDNVESDFSFSI